jgi:hypothetical protein
VEASSADPSDDSTWWCTLPRTSGIGNTGACHRPEAFPGLANSGTSRPSAPDCIDFGIDPLFDCLDASPSSSLVASPSRYRPHGASSSARGFLCGSLPSATLTAPRRPRLPYARHLRPRLFTLQFGCIDIGTKGYHPHELLAGFLSSRSVRTAPTFQLRGDVSPSAYYFQLLLQSHCVRCSRRDCEGMLEYIW